MCTPGEVNVGRARRTLVYWSGMWRGAAYVSIPRGRVPISLRTRPAGTL
jgi:hypothetical protein